MPVPCLTLAIIVNELQKSSCNQPEEDYSAIPYNPTEPGGHEPAATCFGLGGFCPNP
ncbi:hypothetical protein TEQG_08805 [Trichophyton equinum CBS 127.97]|uniref:Uncharacterized protein n=1 Tax=Trichophyton equinum (strain ATCC MYA-4606 / CBS 127.97) TaxID=559882 RepID=F2Q331_TRIEC|nr:hypothetical protein TEQG_08805 [Trichophyton equinum CBS 127.97]